MIFRSNALAVFVGLMVSGCAVEGSNVETTVDSAESALEVDCELVDVCPDDTVPGAAQTVTLTSFDMWTGALTYVAGSSTVTSMVTPRTRARIAAPINKYPPHPILPLVVRWNALVLEPGPASFGDFQSSSDVDPVGFATLTSSLASAGARMKLKVNLDGTVKALRPVP